MRSFMSLGLCLLCILISNSFLGGSVSEGQRPQGEPLHYLQAGAFSCARGWQNNRGNCYAFFEDLKTWYEAEAECKRYSHGAHLASILTKAESDFMSEYTSNYRRNGNNIWIGLHTFHQDRKWRWADGAAYTYNTWMPREPNNQGGNEDCVELWRSSDFSKWNDAPCTKRNAYICMYEL